MDTEQPSTSQKRKINTKHIDPDTGAQIQNPKRPKVNLDPKIKIKVLKAIINGFTAVLTLFFPGEAEFQEAFINVTISSQITSILFALHNTQRQAANNQKTNAMQKTQSSDPKIHTNKQDRSINRKAAEDAWIKACRDQGLEYKTYSPQDASNWYGTAGPYIDFFRSYALRLGELRAGHSELPTKKGDDERTAVPLSRYGINGAHHVLLEGITYPPEVKSSMAQSVGPLTALLTMFQHKGIYRSKWENAVKRAFSHINCIDDIIEVTKGNHSAADLSPIISLLGDIALITTTRQATRMHLPLCMLAGIYRKIVLEEKGDEFLEFFSTSGPGGYYAYALASNFKWIMEGDFKEEVAGQVCFHGIFGTYKEDLGVLEQITDRSRWYKRSEIGSQFRKATNTGKAVTFLLPKLKYYSKLSAANQSGLLANTSSQISCIPCFSGKRLGSFSAAFFAYMSRRNVQQTGGKTIPQLISSLSSILQGLLSVLGESGGNLELGTTNWFSMETLDLNKPGTSTDFVARTSGRYFLGAD
uniref:NP n=2 Tax=root TaxID=1 RepID=A0A3G1PW31_9ORTO|nr:NP [Photinus pyralis orthomyxo-like virus 2]